MARPRFHRLDQTQQQAILDAALTEFAARGFADASLNRIIESAGISKGSMYYYFDGKEDLYAHVIRDRLEAVIERDGPFPVPEERDPQGFWTVLAGYYLRLMRALMGEPQTAALLRGWLAGAGTPSLGAAAREAEQRMLPWLMQTLSTGQRIGAVRTDLAPELILGTVMGLGQAIDVWLISNPPADAALEDAVSTVIDLIRRVVAP